MSHTIKSFEHGLRSSENWVHSLASQAGWDNNQAYHILVSVLHTLRDRLPHEEAAHLAAQLPLIIRGAYWEGWRPSHTPEKYRSPEEFLERVAKGVPSLGVRSAGDATFQVMRFLGSHLTSGEMRHVMSEMPSEIQGLLQHQEQPAAA